MGLIIAIVLSLYAPSAAQAASASQGSAASAVQRTTSARKTCGATYRVQRGDTLSGIARKCGVKLATLRKLNNLGKKSTIWPGQKLVIRPQKPVQQSKSENNTFIATVVVPPDREPTSPPPSEPPQQTRPDHLPTPSPSTPP